MNGTGMTKKRRVRFAPGPLSDRYHTEDGHPQHEGQTAVQKRVVQSSWPVDLTAHNIKMLEVEIGEICQQSIQRLKRRVGLLPPLQRELHYLTSPASDDINGTCSQHPIYSKQRSHKQPNRQSSSTRARKASRIAASVPNADETISQQQCTETNAEQVPSLAEEVSKLAEQVTNLRESRNACTPQSFPRAQINTVYRRAKQRPAQAADTDNIGHYGEDTGSQQQQEQPVPPVNAMDIARA